MMLKTLGGSLALVALVAAPPSAGLRYSIHQEVRRSATSGQDEITAMISNAMIDAFPAGGLDQSVIAGAKGVRTEQKQAFAGLPAGTVTIERPDGTAVGMDPAAKTFWKQAAAADAASQMQQLGLKPQIKVAKTGEFETLEGMRAERVTVTIGLPLPGVDPAQAPPGFGQLTMTIDVWMTDAIKSPAGSTVMEDAMLAKFGISDLATLKDLNDGRFMLKQVMKLFGLEFVTTVKNITKGDVPDALFDVPQDFKEVPLPKGGGIPAGGGE